MGQGMTARANDTRARAEVRREGGREEAGQTSSFEVHRHRQVNGSRK
jgi:hypothetical protein